MILAPSQEIPEGEYRVVDANGESWLVACLGGKLTAVRNLCSHQPKPLSGGVLEGGRLECPHHAVTYDLRTGEVIDSSGFVNLPPSSSAVAS